MRDIVLPAIYENKINSEDRPPSLRIWSAGCSSGEEPYSIALLLQEDFRKELLRFPTNIMATDLDEEMIRRGREGIYDFKALKELQPQLIEKYFIPLSDGRYKILDKAKKLVTFKKRNIMEDKVYSEQDIIFCRNILIYFAREQQEQILLKLASALSKGGFLILGKAETLIAESRKLFKMISARERIYQKK